MDTLPLDSATGPRVLHAFGEEVHLYLTGADTDGRFTQWLVITPPGGGPPPHSHEHEDEWFHVLEGHVSFLRDGTWKEAGPGARVFAPKGSAHTFKNIGETPSRMLLTAMPSGFEDFFAKCAAEFACPEGPDMPRVMAIAAEHGIHFVNA
jgi:quercetin dioxygenase-like cupin family protein